SPSRVQGGAKRVEASAAGGPGRVGGVAGRPGRGGGGRGGARRVRGAGHGDGRRVHRGGGRRLGVLLEPGRDRPFLSQRQRFRLCTGHRRPGAAAGAVGPGGGRVPAVGRRGVGGGGRPRRCEFRVLGRRRRRGGRAVHHGHRVAEVGFRGSAGQL